MADPAALSASNDENPGDRQRRCADRPGARTRAIRLPATPLGH